MRANELLAAVRKLSLQILTEEADRVERETPSCITTFIQFIARPRYQLMLSVPSLFSLCGMDQDKFAHHLWHEVVILHEMKVSRRLLN